MPAQTQKVDDFIRSVLISRNENNRRQWHLRIFNRQQIQTLNLERPFVSVSFYHSLRNWQFCVRWAKSYEAVSVER